MDIPQPLPESPKTPGRMYVVTCHPGKSTFVVQKGVLGNNGLEDVVLSWKIEHGRIYGNLGATRTEFIEGEAYSGAFNIDVDKGEVRRSPAQAEEIYTFSVVQRTIFRIRRKEVFRDYDASIAQILRDATEAGIKPERGIIRGAFEIPWELRDVLSKCQHQYRS